MVTSIKLENERTFTLLLIAFLRTLRLMDKRVLNPSISFPKVPVEADATWHQFVIRCGKRAESIDFFKINGIGSAIHYPIPPHLSKAYEYLGKGRGSYPIAERMANEVLSIPMYNGMTKEEQDKVIETINSFG